MRLLTEQAAKTVEGMKLLEKFMKRNEKKTAEKLAEVEKEADEVRRRTGWEVVWGPLDARHLPSFLSGQDSPHMRLAEFGAFQRIEMAVMWAAPLSLLALALVPFWPEGALPLVGAIWGAALTVYLPVRGEAQTDHVLIYHQQAVNPALIQNRLRRYGEQAQVEISPHRLRHTLATRLLNGGMPITSIQRLLGHEKLGTTLIYARVHNETVRRDYERAHARLAVPASSLADELFDAPTEIAEPQPITPKVNYA